MINSNHVDYLEIQKELIEKVYDIYCWTVKTDYEWIGKILE